VKCGACKSKFPDPDKVDGITYFVCSNCGNMFEVEKYAPIRTQELIDRIKSAFSGVTLEQGIGLFQAQAIDDYESEEMQKKRRENDEKTDWMKIHHETLQRCHSSLSFFDSEGMRFHLPAFIISNIENKVDDCIFHLTQDSEYTKSKFIALNEFQKGAVVSYLTWCLSKEDYEFYHEDIKNALKNIWS
jgi:hypothetical protein